MPNSDAACRGVLLPNVDKRDTNLYLYAGNDPINMMDTLGTQAQPAGPPGSNPPRDTASTPRRS